jgi:exosortase/archaeosortase family protein
LFLIEKSCAGINFMIAAFAMVTLALSHRIESTTSAVRVVAVSVLASYAAALMVNASRIALAMWLAVHRVAVGRLSSAQIHRLEGIVVYFGGLVLLYKLVHWIDRSPARRLAVPVAWYYAITLALPVANGAAAAGAVFVEHALVVLVLPPLLIVMAFAATDILRLAAHHIAQLFRSGAYGPIVKGYCATSSRQNR